MSLYAHPQPLDCKGKRAKVDRVLCPPNTITRLAETFLIKAGCPVKLPLLGLLRWLLGDKCGSSNVCQILLLSRSFASF